MGAFIMIHIYFLFDLINYNFEVDFFAFSSYSSVCFDRITWGMYGGEYKQASLLNKVCLALHRRVFIHPSFETRTMMKTLDNE